ncbi:glycoside hydrolase family 13 protein [Texcoconibacillus texcoconensis]|uniref:oligo-1,6-glucosidase n=1 Tax=Texcoconibacillus texcoconensis TaxID=1095777 RepID=A0A840QTZ3_9BACI|nr:alpha-glucosidase [Texcoconibacillus texcoconensis]MBB5175026.1 oligo-1,6-glucosidase [Texcoconibacillus texcoconensis]
MERNWWKESVVYQIYPRSFNDSNGDGIGDIPGIIEKLDYLKYLGIDVIWLSPVYQSPNDDNGYDISHYDQIMEDFGTMEDWEHLLAEVHNRGMKLIMDLVVNHTSDEHGWFQEAKKSKDNKYREYYIWRSGKEDGKEPNNWGATFGGSAWEYNEETEDYYLHLFSPKQPDLNWENPELREEIYTMMRKWLDRGIDGFRMDVINFISKTPGLPDAPKEEDETYASGGQFFMNGPRIHEFLQEMNEKALKGYDVMTVGEMPGVDVEEAKKYTDLNRNELQMVFQFEHMDLDSGPGGKFDLKPLDLRDLKKSISRWQTGLNGIGWNSLYLNNHDQPRVVSRFGDDKNYHDESAKMLGTFLHMLQGTPYIYQGEEIGMTNIKFDSIEDYRDIETINYYNEQVYEKGRDKNEVMESIYVKGRDNARTPVQWDDSPHAGFTTGEPWIKVNDNYETINAEKALQDEESIFHYYRKLIQLRKEHDVIVYGDYELLLPEDEKVFAYKRRLDDDILFVLTNFSDETVEVNVPENIEINQPELLIGNYKGEKQFNSKTTLQPYEARVYKGKHRDGSGSPVL